jgi:hypothetical protein
MAERCAACGSADTSTGGGSFTCLICGAVTGYDGLTEQRVTADSSVYYGDDGTEYQGGRLPSEKVAVKPVKKAAAKKAS